MSEYKPGTVAVATVRGVPDVQVIRTVDHPDGGKGWVSATSVGSHYTHTDMQVIDVRPLVVLDPEDAAQPSPSFRARNAAWLRAYAARLREGGFHTAADMHGYIADQIEAQTKPPRIPEPEGVGAVVEASSRYFPSGATYVRTAHHRWASPDGFCTWDDLINPVLIREGVAS